MLARNGVETEVVYPRCCGMPLLEQGRIADVAAAPRKVVAPTLKAWIDKGYDVIALVPSCALMLKFEWPLILPDDPDVRITVTRDLRHQRIHRRYRPEGRPGARPGADARRP